MSAKYTEKTDILQYVPTGEKPELNELVDTNKAEELITAVMMSDVTWDEKVFLMKAAQRHLAFNYRKVAEYYAHANKEMQELMEQSALVIIDFDNAIENGYVKLSKRIKELSGVNA